jgi:hypothetical protein
MGICDFGTGTPNPLLRPNQTVRAPNYLDRSRNQQIPFVPKSDVAPRQQARVFQFWRQAKRCPISGPQRAGLTSAARAYQNPFFGTKSFSYCLQTYLGVAELIANQIELNIAIDVLSSFAPTR